MSPRNVWLTIAAALIALDIWAARNNLEGDTLSECTRELFRTDTPAGRAALVGAWAALTAWLIPHLLRTNTRGAHNGHPTLHRRPQRSR